MDEAALDALIDAGTAALGIEMKPEWRPAVRMHLAISLSHAATVLETHAERHGPARPGQLSPHALERDNLVLSDHLDPAPMFRA